MSENETGEKSFAELFEAGTETPGRRFFPGDKVLGKIIQISRDTVFVDLGGKSEGFADLHEFLDSDGNLTVKQGDQVEMRVASLKEGVRLTKGIKVQGEEALDLLREAKENQIPVEGRVVSVKKGGFEVDLSGLRAFCPLGQMTLPFCEKPEEHIGARYPFRIMEIKEKGRNIVVSRRVLLEEELKKKSEETLATLQPGIETHGRVTKLTAFGAFVDLGGIEGLVHVSEIAHGRIHDPAEVLKPGQMVRVKVLKIETEKEGRPRVGLSIKALEPDAWEKGLGVEEGQILRGRISRLADFGVFVEVAPGVDGLVHISEISYDRISHPSKVLREGDMVDVMVMGIDHKTRRISLSIKEASIQKRISEGEGREKAALEVGQILRGIVEDVKPYGLFVRLPQLGARTRGLLPLEELGGSEKGDLKKRFPRGEEIQVEIVSIDQEGKIRLSQRVIQEREDQADFQRFIEERKKGEGLGTLGDIFKDLKLR